MTVKLNSELLDRAHALCDFNRVMADLYPVDDERNCQTCKALEAHPQAGGDAELVGAAGRFVPCGDRGTVLRDGEVRALAEGGVFIPGRDEDGAVRLQLVLQREFGADADAIAECHGGIIQARIRLG